MFGERRVWMVQRTVISRTRTSPVGQYCVRQTRAAISKPSPRAASGKSRIPDAEMTSEPSALVSASRVSAALAVRMAILEALRDEA